MHGLGSSFGFASSCIVAASQTSAATSQSMASCAMAAPPERWRFWDFGSLQFVQDTLSGELVVVHGNGAVFGDGPFKFAVDDDGRPVVVGLEGDDDHCALHLVDEKMANDITFQWDVQTKEWHHYVKSRCGEKPALRLTDLQGDNQCFRLVCEVEGGTPFKAEFSRFAAPEWVGECTVQLWLHLPWLVEYVEGKDAHRRRTRTVELLRASLQRMGLSPLHVVDSLLSRQRCRRKAQAADADDDVDGSQDWRVSMVGVFVYLFEKIRQRRAHRSNKIAAPQGQLSIQRAKAELLLPALLSWPLVGVVSIGLVCRRSEYELLLEGLVASPPTGNKKRQKISRSNWFPRRLVGRCNPHGLYDLLWVPLT